MKSGELNDDEMRMKDELAKEKGKYYSDAKRHAKRHAGKSNVQEGDTVLLKNHAMGKLEPAFGPNPFLVLSRSGNEVILQGKDGVQYRRCVTHVKKWRADVAK